MSKYHGFENGWTLTEVLVTLIVMGILATIAYPSMMNILYTMEARKVESSINNALIFARSESYTRRYNLMVCFADKMNVCHKQADEKIIVFKDINENNIFDLGELIQEYHLGLKYGRLDMRVSLGRDYIKYFANTGTPRGHFGHIKYCSESDRVALSYKIVVAHQGMIRKEKEKVGC